jgi:hypothetical protein
LYGLAANAKKMSIDASKDQAEFVEEVLFSSAFSAAVQHSKTYSGDVSPDCKNWIRAELKVLLQAIRTSSAYLVGGVSEDVHRRTIQDFASDVGRICGQHLHENKFRIGTAQKLLNLYLKLYWCIGEIAEPPHCPIDRVIIGALDPKYHDINWTTLDDLALYQQLIDAVKSLASGGDDQLSVAAWELKNYPELAMPRTKS